MLRIDWLSSLFAPHYRKRVRRGRGRLNSQVEAFEQRVMLAAATATVSGTVQWKDSAGGLHALPSATIEIRDEEATGSELIATTTTNAAGMYSIEITHDDGPMEGTPDIFVRVLARSAIADIAPTSGGTTYSFDSTTTMDISDGPLAQNVNIDNGDATVDDNESVFSVHHSLVSVGQYASTLAGSAPSQIDVVFPSTGSFYDPSAGEIHLVQGDRWDWDVIQHEYGHYFMAVHGFVNNPGGSHSFEDNLAQSRGSKDIGVRLAWGEGWPTYFGIASQLSMGTAALGIPNVGDVVYQDTEDASISLNLETSTGVGEDNEVSVMASLWDLFDANGDGVDELLSVMPRYSISSMRLTRRRWRLPGRRSPTLNRPKARRKSVRSWGKTRLPRF